MIKPFYCENCKLPTYRHINGFHEQGGKLLRGLVPNLFRDSGRSAGDFPLDSIAAGFPKHLAQRAVSNHCPGYKGRNLP